MGVSDFPFAVRSSCLPALGCFLEALRRLPRTTGSRSASQVAHAAGAEVSKCLLGERVQPACFGVPLDPPVETSGLCIDETSFLILRPLRQIDPSTTPTRIGDDLAQSLWTRRYETALGPVCALFDQLSARAFSAARARNAERFLARSSIRRSRRSVRVMFTRTVRSAASGRVTRKATASLFSGSAMITSSELGEGNSSPSSTIPLT